MNGGRIARYGFYYQDLAALWLWLRESISITASNNNTSIKRFGVEANHNVDTSWDVIIEFSHGEYCFFEAKAGKIPPEEKNRIFWQRVRTQAKGNVDKMRIGWILSPKEGQRFADKLIELRKNTAHLNNKQIPQKQSKASIRTWKNLCDAALYWLCQSKSRDVGHTNPPQLSIQQAKRLLQNLEVVVINKQELENKIDQILNAFFPDSFPDDVLKQLVGHLRENALKEGTGLIECHHLLQKIETLFGSKRNKPALAFLKQCWSTTLPILKSGVNTNKIELQSIENLVDQHTQNTLKNTDSGLVVVLGHAGVGKSILAKLVLQSHSKDQYYHFSGIPRLLFVSSYNLTKHYDVEGKSRGIKAAIDSFWLAVRILAGFGKTTIVFDGLDEVPKQHLDHLAKRLCMLCDLPEVCLVVTCRDEVWKTEEYLSPLKNSLAKYIELKEWNEKLVKSVIAEKSSTVYVAQMGNKLLRILKTPFFLDIFLQLLETSDVKEKMLDIKNHIDLLIKYKGVRIDIARANEPKTTHSSKAKKVACEKLIRQSLKGNIAFKMDLYPGNKGLLDSGILVRSAGDRVHFRHRLLQDFLIADYLIGIASEKGGLQKIWKILHASSDVIGRSEVVQCFLALGFGSEYKTLQKLGISWISFNEDIQKKDQDLYYATVHGYACLTPDDYNNCFPGVGSDAPSLTNTTLIWLVKYLRGFVRVGQYQHAHRWWEGSIQYWNINKEICSLELLHELAILAEVLFRKKGNPIKITDEQRAEVGNLLVKWSHLLQYDDIENGKHYWLFWWTCEFLDTIPSDWLLRMIRTSNSRIVEKASEHLSKLDDQRHMANVFMQICNTERELKTPGAPCKWHFKTYYGAMFLHVFIDNIIKQDLVSKHSQELFGAVAALIDAIDNTEKQDKDKDKEKNKALLPSVFFPKEQGQKTHPLPSTFELYEDYSDIWFWSSSLNNDQKGKLVQTVLDVLTDFANKSEGESFTSLCKQLYNHSDMILFRTLTAESLFCNRNKAYLWHKDIWYEMLSDARIYASHSIKFWLLWALQHQFEDLSEVQQKIIISSLKKYYDSGDISTCDIRYARILKTWLVKFDEGKDILRLLDSNESKHIGVISHPKSEREFCQTISWPSEFDTQCMKDWLEKADERHFKALYEAESKLRTFTEKSKEKLLEKRKENYQEGQTLVKSCLSPLSYVLQRNNEDLTCGYPLGWVALVLKTLRVTYSLCEEVDQEKNWFQMLQDYAPWLQNSMERVLYTFQNSFPQGDHWENNDFEGYSSWPDPWICALEVWDLLALPPASSRTQEWEKNLIEVMGNRTSSFPEQLRMYFVLRLRVYHWNRSNYLKEILWQWVNETNDAKLLSWYLHIAYKVFPKRRSELTKLILDKGCICGKRRSLDRNYLGPILASAWFRIDKHEKDSQIASLAKLANNFLSGQYPSSPCRSLVEAFSRGLLDAFRQGFADNLPYVNFKRYTEGLRKAWELCKQTCPGEDAQREGNGSRHFATLLDFSFEIPMTDESFYQVADELAEFTKTLARECDLPGHTWLTTALRKHEPINKERIRVSNVPSNWKVAIEVARALLDGLMTIRQKIKKTNDLGYASALSGADIVALIEEWIVTLGRSSDNILKETICELENIPGSGAERLRIILYQF